MKSNDHFSKQSKLYAKYRPLYPELLFKFLSEISPSQKLAWDCATGNGQAAAGLARFFNKVIATDISHEQISNAIQLSNIQYEVMGAEETHIQSNSVDLIAVAQALHWFNIEKFYSEAKRVLTNKGIIAVWTYNLFRISPEIDALIDYFYTNIVGKYWPAERKLVYENYENIPFPFEKINTPEFSMKTEWSLEHLIGYLDSWSAVQRYKDAKSSDPVKIVYKDLKSAWIDTSEIKHVQWKLTLKVGIYYSN